MFFMLQFILPAAFSTGLSGTKGSDGGSHRRTVLPASIKGWQNIQLPLGQRNDNVDRFYLWRGDIWQ